MILRPEILAQHFRLICLGACLLVFVSMFFSLALGAVPIGMSELLAWVTGNAEPQTALILEQIRLPRTLLGAIVGALLALCGAITQGLFRNPLADPPLIGVTAGASVGASIVIVLLSEQSGSFFGLSLISVGAFIGSIIAVFFVYRLATGPSGTSVATMLLAGIAITYLAGSISSLFEFIADNEMLRRISLWRMGGLESANYIRVSIAGVLALVIFSTLPFYHAALNAFLLGESEARHLGFNVARIKILVVLCVAAGVGTSVALAGTITFVGLIVPHMVRLVVGPNHRYLLPLTACSGAILLVFADTVARTVIAPTELPVGLVTAMLGAPIFISLLRRRHEYGMR